MPSCLILCVNDDGTVMVAPGDPANLPQDGEQFQTVAEALQAVEEALDPNGTEDAGETDPAAAAGGPGMENAPPSAIDALSQGGPQGREADMQAGFNKARKGR